MVRNGRVATACCVWMLVFRAMSSVSMGFHLQRAFHQPGELLPTPRRLHHQRSKLCRRSRSPPAPGPRTPLSMRGGEGPPAIDFYYWPVPCGWKVAIMLEECGMRFNVHPTNILAGEQFDPAYLEKNPNNKVPTVVDHDGPDGTPFTVFESGAILLYLGEKADSFLGGPPGSAARHLVVQWLMFQMASVGPMFGQTGYWRNYARGDDTELRHGRERYGNETLRIYRVLDKRLAAAPFLAGSDYSVADMAVYPWIQPFMHLEEAQRDLADFPHVRQWYERIKARPAVQRAYELLAKDCKIGDRSDATHLNLFEKQKSVGVSAAAVPQRSTDARALPNIELWYTPIDNHVHAVEAVVAYCELEACITVTPTSPFGVDLTADPPRPGFASLSEANPLLTVPAAKVDGSPLYGGPVIYEFLNTLRPDHVPSLFPAEPAAALETRRSLWLADGLFDQFVVLLLEINHTTPRDDAVRRQWGKVVECLQALNSDAKRWRSAHAAAGVARLDIAQLRAACTLDFIEKRPGPALAAGAGEGWSWREGREELAAWFDEVRSLPIFSSQLASKSSKR